MLRVALRVVAIALVVALGTAWLGWWSVPVICAAYGFMDRTSRMRGTMAAAGAVIAWGAMLVGASLEGASVGVAAARFGAVVGAPAFVLVLLALVFAALLAGPAAVIGAAIGDQVGARIGRR